MNILKNSFTEMMSELSTKNAEYAKKINENTKLINLVNEENSKLQNTKLNLKESYDDVLAIGSDTNYLLLFESQIKKKNKVISLTDLLKQTNESKNESINLIKAVENNFEGVESKEFFINLFKNELTTQYETFSDPAYKMKDNVDNSLDALNTALNKFYNSLKSNDEQSNELLNELKGNQKEITKLDDELLDITNKIQELNIKITKSLDTNLMSDYRYYYYGNQLSNIELNSRKRVNIDSLKELNKTKQSKYDLLINLLSDLPNGEVQELLISNIVDKNDKSNLEIDIITKGNRGN